MDNYSCYIEHNISEYIIIEYIDSCYIEHNISTPYNILHLYVSLNAIYYSVLTYCVLYNNYSYP